jgi:monoterpene epsilon-lactone hydrolase
MTAELRDQFRKILVEQVAPGFRPEVPLVQQRLALEAVGAQAQLPEGTTVERSELGGITTEWIVAPGASKRHAVLHLHGGGYVMGSCGSHRGFSGWVSASVGVQVVLPEYRVAPEHPYPAALDDAVAAYRGLLARGFSPGELAILGDSAGGGLALATLQALRDAKVPLPAAGVLLSPWLDLSGSGETMTTRAGIDPWLDPTLLVPFGKLYRGELEATDPRVSPLFGEVGGLPPLLVQVGDHEILLSDSTRLAERAKEAGTELVLEVAPELWHVYQLFAPMLPDANEALARVGAFVRGRLGL